MSAARTVAWQHHGSIARVRRSVHCEGITGSGERCTRPAVYHYEGLRTGATVCRQHLLTDYVHGFEGRALMAWAAAHAPRQTPPTTECALCHRRGIREFEEERPGRHVCTSKKACEARVAARAEARGEERDR